MRVTETINSFRYPHIHFLYRWDYILYSRLQRCVFSLTFFFSLIVFSLIAS